MVGRPTRTRLLVLLIIQLTCTRGSLLITAGTCCLRSKLHLRNLRRCRTRKTSLSNKRYEANRLRRMLEGLNIIHISNLWRLPQRLVWLHRKIHDSWTPLSPSWAPHLQTANDCGRVRKSRSLCHSRHQARPSDQTGRLNRSARQNHVQPRLRVRLALCKTSCQS